MPRWLDRLLNQVREFASAGHVQLTYKALREALALGFGFELEEICDVLCQLDQSDFHDRFQSESTQEWMYVFKPEVGGIVLYVNSSCARTV